MFSTPSDFFWGSFFLSFWDRIGEGKRCCFHVLCFIFLLLDDWSLGLFSHTIACILMLEND